MPSKMPHEIVFPAYRLPVHDNIYRNKLGILKMDTAHTTWDLDDDNLTDPYPVRRIKMKSAGRKVYPLKVKLDYFAHMVRYTSGTSFIDSTGAIFEYKKGRVFWKLIYFRISRLELAEHGGITILRAEKVPCPMVFHAVLNSQLKYIGLLCKGGMYIPYDLSFTKKKDSRRKV